MTLTKREEFAVWYTALLLIPERSLDYDSKQRMLQCAAVAIGITDEKLETMKKLVYDELTRMKKVLDACYGPSKDDREFSNFTN